MNLTAENNAGTDEITSITEEYTLHSSMMTSNVPENSMLQRTSMSAFYGGNDFSESITDVTEDGNKSVYYDQCFSEGRVSSIFSKYPPELLCFGAICFIVFAIVGILGNFVSILALSKCQRLRNATTSFIVNLCVADFLFCTFSMPLSAITFVDKNWCHGDVLCTLFPLVRYSNGAVSLFSVIAITVNRYILIVHSKFYSTMYTKRNIGIMITSIWALSFLILLPPLLGIWGTLGYDKDTGTCTILKVNGKSPKIFLYITAFILPSTIFIFCYIKIFLVVRKASKKSQRKEDKVGLSKLSFSFRKGIVSKRYRHSEMPEMYVQHRQKSELRVLRLMLVIFVLFIVCYFPVSFVKIFHKEGDLHIMNVLGYLGVYFSNIINPIIYIVMSKEYRRAYKELFCKTSAK